MGHAVRDGRQGDDDGQDGDAAGGKDGEGGPPAAAAAAAAAAETPVSPRHLGDDRRSARSEIKASKKH